MECKLSAALKEIRTILSTMRALREGEPDAQISISSDLKKIRVTNIEGIDEHYMEMHLLDKEGVKVVSHSLPNVIQFKPSNNAQGYMTQFHTVYMAN